MYSVPPPSSFFLCRYKPEQNTLSRTLSNAIPVRFQCKPNWIAFNRFMYTFQSMSYFLWILIHRHKHTHFFLFIYLSHARYWGHKIIWITLPRQKKEHGSCTPVSKKESLNRISDIFHNFRWWEKTLANSRKEILCHQLFSSCASYYFRFAASYNVICII